MAAPREKVLDVSQALRRSLWRRFASHAHLTDAGYGNIGLPEGINPLKPEEADRRKKWDDLEAMAVFLDPAVWPFLNVMGFHPDDLGGPAIRLLKACSEVTAAPAAGGAAAGDGKNERTLNKERKAELAAIDEKVKPYALMSNASWEASKEQLKNDVNLKYDNLVDGLGQYVGDPFTPMQEDLLEEIKKLQVYISNAQKAGRVQPTAVPPVRYAGLVGGEGTVGWATYGDPLAATVNQARYSFWTDHQAEMPLLFFLATVVLGAQATSMEVERMHSLAGRITSRFRACMSPAKTEQLTLANMFLRKMVENDKHVKAMEEMKSDEAEIDAYIERQLLELPASTLEWLEAEAHPEAAAEGAAAE